MLERIKVKIYNLLRWSEKHTKTDMVYLAKGGFWLTTGQVFSSLSGFLLAMAYANFLPKESYGLYKYILSLSGVINSLTLTGMNTAVTQAVARGMEGILKPAFWSNIKWSIFMIFAAFAISIYYFINNNLTIAISILIAGALSPIIQSAALYDAFLNGKKQFKTLTIRNIFRNITPAISIVIVIYFTNNVTLIISTYFLSSILITLLFYLQTAKQYPMHNDMNAYILNYSKHLSVMNILGTVAEYLDKILIFHFFGATELAIYTFSTAVPNQIKAIVSNIKILALPKLSERPIEEIMQMLKNKVILSILIIILLIATYMITASFIYEALFPQYIDSVFYSQIFSLSFFGLIGLLPLTTLKAKAAKKQLYIYTTSMSLFQILATLLFVYFYGILGAIIAIVVHRIVATIVSFLLLKGIK